MLQALLLFQLASYLFLLMPGNQIDEMVYELQQELRGLLPEVISLKIQTLDNLTQ